MTREEAITAVKEVTGMSLPWNDRHYEGLQMGIKELEQPERKWLPCSERLPDVSGRYLVTRGLKAAGAIWNRVYIANFSDLMGLKSSLIFWQGNVGKSDFERLDDVIAWMPLPEPYRE